MISRKRSAFRAEKEFGLVVGGILFLLCGWWIYREKFQPYASIFFGVSILLILLGIVMPKLLTYPSRAWSFVGQVLSAIMTPFILGIIYFGLLTPTGFFKRLFGWNPLGRRGRTRDSYRASYQPYQRDPHHYDKMF